MEQVSVEGRFHVHLVKGLVDLGKLIADIDEVEGLRRGLVKE